MTATASILQAPIPIGLCQCGCGGRTPLAKVNDRTKRWRKGQPLLFIRHHNAKLNAAKMAAARVGARELSSHGYILVNCGNGISQYEHILTAEKALGRPLKNHGTGHPDTEVVHHVNGDKTDNSPSNLLICTHRYHTALHHRLARSPDWPEFPPIIRLGFGKEPRA